MFLEAKDLVLAFFYSLTARLPTSHSLPVPSTVLGAGYGLSNTQCGLVFLMRELEKK